MFYQRFHADVAEASGLASGAGARVLPRVTTAFCKPRGFREAARPVLRTYILGKGANPEKEVVNGGRKKPFMAWFMVETLSGRLEQVSFILKSCQRPSGL